MIAELANCLSLAHELGAQDETLDGVMTAVDFFRIVGEPDRADHRALLQGLASTLDLQVLDQHDAVAIDQDIAGGIADLGGLGLFRSDLRGRAPLAGGFVIDVIVVGMLGHLLFPFPNEVRSLRGQTRLYRGKAPWANPAAARAHRVAQRTYLAAWQMTGACGQNGSNASDRGWRATCMIFLPL